MRLHTQSTVKNAVSLAHLGLWFGLAVLCTACGTPLAELSNVKPTLAIENLPTNLQAVATSTASDLAVKTSPNLISAEMTTTATLDATPTSTSQTIVVWWPAPLSMENKPSAAADLNEDLKGFE